MKCQAAGCNQQYAHKHHIVHKSRGGLNTEINYAHLCFYHHNDMSKVAVHNNRELDLQLKRELQEKYFELFTEEHYSLEEIAKLLNCKEKHIRRIFKVTKTAAGKYIKENIIRALMGGKLY